VFADIGRHRKGRHARTCVVIHTGDNGIISPDDLSSTLNSLADRARVVVVTDPGAPGLARSEQRHTARYRSAVSTMPSWWIGTRSPTGTRTGSTKDALHLRPPGAQAYVAAIAAAVKRPDRDYIAPGRQITFSALARVTLAATPAR